MYTNPYAGVTLNSITPCYLVFGYLAGYTNWYRFDVTTTAAAPLGTESSSRTFYFSGHINNNTGNGGGCDGGEGGTCPKTKGAPLFTDPINVAIGNKYLEQDDAHSGHWLTFRRFYNSDGTAAAGGFGAHWRHSFDRSLALSAASSSQPATMVVTRPDSKIEVFTKTNGQWTPTPDIADVLTEADNASGSPTGYTLFVAALRHIENYDTSGRLLSVTDQTGVGVTLTYSSASTASSVAPYPGLPIAIQDPQGRVLQLTYNSQGLVNQVTSPDGNTITYAYDTNGNLMSVTYPDSKTLTYVYNESSLTGGTSLPNALTGIVDESNTRYEDTFYDSSGRANRARQGQTMGADDTQITYTSSGAQILFPLGVSSMVSLTTTAQGLSKVSSMSQSCGVACEQLYQSRTYDSNGNPVTVTDWNGNVTKTTYDANGLLDQEVDASGTADQRTTKTIWNTSLRVPLTKVVLDNNGNMAASTAWVYNSTGQTLARCDIDPTISAAAGYICSNTGAVPAGVRRSTYTYCTAVDTTQCPVVGLLLTSTGSRTDLTQTTAYTYYLMDSVTARHGDLLSVTDALGHATTYLSYDSAGRVLSQQDANGIITTYAYYPRGWLKTRRVGGAITTFTYTAYGAVQTVTDPDSITVTYGYDTAHRLTTITDAQGNYVQYTLDAAGNRTAENTYAAGSNTVSRTLTRQFNTLGQLTKVVDGLNYTVFNASASGNYDANGNLVQSADANGIAQQNSYDALNRAVEAIANYNGTDTATQNATTQIAYDVLDRLTHIIDPNGLTTAYGYDGLSNPASLQSPDTGSSSSTYDAAGNVLTHTDAKGIVSTSTYDALNRLTGTSYSDNAQTNDNVAYNYDDANSVTGCVNSYPTGRLTKMIESTVTTIYCYDTRGNITRKQQVTSAGTDSTTYTYTAANRLSSISYPSGSQVSYAFDTNGHIQSVALTPMGGSASTVVNSISYLPFGPVSSYTLGNGQTITRNYNANYALTDLTSPALNLHFARDAMGNITAEGNTAGANPATETYTYDPLYRLTNIADGGTALETLTYNPTGDRTSKTGGGLATGNYSYNSSTHQLSSIGNAAWTYDANGNTTGNSSAGQTWGYGYNGRNRLTVVQANGTTVGTYTYNALGQRIQKGTTLPTAITQRFAYDEASHLIGEYTGSNNRDTVWMGDIPIATVDTAGTASTVDYVTADQLGTPRAVSDTSGNTVWSWPYAGNPFGELAPTSTTGYALNLRYPGQYYDAESGLNDNLHRTYESALGRYAQSDPLGLMGGISTYAYVRNNPLSNLDSKGLFLTSVDAVCVRSPEFCLEILGDLTHSEAAIQRKFGNDCNAEGLDAIGDMTEPVGKILKFAPLFNATGEVTEAATEASSIPEAIKAGAKAAAKAGIDYGMDQAKDAAKEAAAEALSSSGEDNAATRPIMLTGDSTNKHSLPSLTSGAPTD